MLECGEIVDDTNQSLMLGVWTLLNIVGCGLAIAITIPIHCPGWVVNSCKRYVRFNEDNDFDVSHSHPNKVTRAHTVTMVLALAVAHFYINELYERFFMAGEMVFLYCGVILLTIPVFGFLGQVKGLQTSISSGSFPTWPLLSKIVYSVVGIIVLTVLGWEVYTAYDESYLIQYLLFAGVILSYYVCLWVVANFREANVIHIHHWWIGYMLSFAIQSDTIPTNIFFCILYGVFLEGANVYGLTSIFKN